MIVRGIVKDAATGKTLPQATVAVYSQSNNALIGGTTTNASGEFQIGVLSGNYVKISYVGYQPLVPLLYADGVHDYELQPGSVNNPEATVTANKSYTGLIMVAVAVALVYFLIDQK